jgi:hypothetical protein
MGSIYIQNKSDSDIIEFMGLDGINVLATLEPGKFIEVKSKPGTALTPFIVRQKPPRQQGQ